MAYSKKVLDHYENPRNVGSFDKEDINVGTGMVGAPACLHGDTLVVLADGRRCLSIRELALIGDDVSIYAWGDTGYHIETGYKPRLTRENAHCIKIIFDDNSFIIGTDDHELYKYSRNGRKKHFAVPFSKLKVGDSVHPFSRMLNSSYFRIESGHSYEKEHRMIYKFNKGDIPPDFCIYHIDHDKINNAPDNLEKIKLSAHNTMHMLGDSNPSRRFPEKNVFRKGFKKEANGRWIAVSNEEILKQTRGALGLNFSYKQYIEHAKKRNFPQNLASRFGTFSQFKADVQTFNHRILSIEDYGFSDVYCLTTEYSGCFAVATSSSESLDSGILVSNCGDVMRLQIKVNADGIIEDAVFKTYGCGSAIASSSLVTEWVKGKTLEQAAQITNSEIVTELELPPVKIHCSVLAEDAIKAAITDYKSKFSAGVLAKDNCVI